jgi:hypothetical protein
MAAMASSVLSRREGSSSSSGLRIADLAERLCGRVLHIHARIGPAEGHEKRKRPPAKGDIYLHGGVPYAVIFIIFEADFKNRIISVR